MVGYRHFGRSRGGKKLHPLLNGGMPPAAPILQLLIGEHTVPDKQAGPIHKIQQPAFLFGLIFIVKSVQTRSAPSPIL